MSFKEKLTGLDHNKTFLLCVGLLLFTYGCWTGYHKMQKMREQDEDEKKKKDSWKNLLEWLIIMLMVVFGAMLIGHYIYARSVHARVPMQPQGIPLYNAPPQPAPVSQAPVQVPQSPAQAPSLVQAPVQVQQPMSVMQGSPRVGGRGSPYVSPNRYLSSSDTEESAHFNQQ